MSLAAVAVTAVMVVMTEPPWPSRISIDGHVADDWGVYTDLSPGLHYVCFVNVPGRITSSCVFASLTVGSTATVTGTYLTSFGV